MRQFFAIFAVFLVVGAITVQAQTSPKVNFVLEIEDEYGNTLYAGQPVEDIVEMLNEYDIALQTKRELNNEVTPINDLEVGLSTEELQLLDDLEDEADNNAAVSLPDPYESYEACREWAHEIAALCIGWEIENESLVDRYRSCLRFRSLLLSRCYDYHDPPGGADGAW